MRKTQLINNEFYHIYNRGTDKRIIFNDDFDFCRFVFQMYACNVGRPVNIFRKGVAVPGRIILEGGEPIKGFIVREGSPLVNILSFCLMPNHFHFILQQRAERGISKFMQKLGTAYTMYFNLRNERSGSLFQGKFKAVHIGDENFLLHLSRYIHLNPIEILQSHWKEEGIREWEKANDFLESFQWSSYPDYIGLRKSKITDRNIFNYYFNFFSKKGVKDYKEFLISWLIKDLKPISSLLLE